jgi:hypothetical protein
MLNLKSPNNEKYDLEIVFEEVIVAWVVAQSLGNPTHMAPIGVTCCTDDGGLG